MDTQIAQFDMRAGNNAVWGGETPQVVILKRGDVFIVRDPWGDDRAYADYAQARKAAIHRAQA